MYSELNHKHSWTDSLHRFWTFGIRLTQLGATAQLGIQLAPKSKELNTERYDLGEVSRFLQETIFLRAIENFQVYVVELLLEIFEARPEIVPKGSISYRELFNSTDLGELRKVAIQRVVLGYSFQNVVDLSHEISKNLNFDIFPRRLRSLRMRRLVEVRNLIVHNRSVINHQFIEKCGSKFDKFGSNIVFPNPIRTLKYLDRVAHDIDFEACKKFIPDKIYMAPQR